MIAFFRISVDGMNSMGFDVMVKLIDIVAQFMREKYVQRTMER